MRVLVYASEIDRNGQLVTDQQSREGHHASLRNADYFDGSVSKVDQVVIVNPHGKAGEIEAAYVRKGIPVAHFIGSQFAPPAAQPAPHEPSLPDEDAELAARLAVIDNGAMSEAELRDEAFRLLMDGLRPVQIAGMLGVTHQKIGKLPYTKSQQRALAKRNA